ncbi:Sugar lactone lactonase YvrE [Poseidonocella pacifica]|uniref:Sugar lactone lactonase YvrE n=1 Tax=Poseidonocella pacifica TaxID=871651 RepID=A0A1I0XX75_9RHOB|nr:SMP-30/gluconolactonase/LRE family protein [Poseidonocella pacifica]SFB04900.1 Sugar lactone lactonase YvrE [Poseidonocella pacifica]
MNLYDPRLCLLGEGPLWHPVRQELFWFDILNRKLHSRQQSWEFDRYVSAAGWISETALLVASETDLFRFDLSQGSATSLIPLEAGDPQTRSNDGRADPWGGFWIGTMGKRAEHEAGAIYRYFRGELRKLHGAITIPNAICFSPDRQWAYFADTKRQVIYRQALGPEGWPSSPEEPFIDLAPEGRNPDGAVVDSSGALWCAEWGSGEVSCYGQDGALRARLSVGLPQPSCPAFGGTSFDRLFVTTAREGMDVSALETAPDSGCVVELDPGVAGIAEHRVLI